VNFAVEFGEHGPARSFYQIDLYSAVQVSSSRLLADEMRMGIAGPKTWDVMGSTDFQSMGAYSPCLPSRTCRIIAVRIRCIGVASSLWL